MFLIILLAVAALGLAATAEFFSVVGLATTYAGSFYSVVALGCAIGFGKLVSVSFLYRFWVKLSIGFRAVLTTIIVAMMLITSFGTFGFLTKANQTDMVALKQTNASQALLESESVRLAARKVQIDQQVAQLKPEDVQGRIRLNRQFKDELKEINTRLPLIEKEKAQLAGDEIKQQSDVGPLVYLAKSMHLDVDIATTWFTLLLVIVLDPAAVVLTLCTNIAIAHRQHKSPTVEYDTPELPVSTDDPRPAFPIEGSIRFNEEYNQFEQFANGEWHFFKPHDDNVPATGSSVTSTIQTAPAVEQPEEQAVVEEEQLPVTSPVLDHVVGTLPTIQWVPDAPPTSTRSAFEDVAATLSQQPESTQGELDFNTPFVEEQPVTGTLTNPQVANAALQSVFTDQPDYFKNDEQIADGLLDEVAIAQGPQPVLDTTGIEQNSFGQPNRAAWDTFVNVSNSITNNHNGKSQQDFKTHLQQLQAYIDELDSRATPVSDDEAALRSRIISFIQRHQPTSQV